MSAPTTTPPGAPLAAGRTRLGAGPAGGGAGRRRSRRTKLLVGIGLGLFCLVWVYPFLWVLSASFKQQSEIFGSGLSLLPEALVWENYVRAWQEIGFDSYFLNSVLITAGTVAIIVIRSALAGYVLGRCDFPGKKLLIGIFLVTFFLPEGYTIIPITQLTDALGLLNTHAGVILGLGAGGHVAATLLYAGYFRSLPAELEESARVDGAGPVTIFARVMLPLAWPVTATVIILQFLTAWNAYLLPLVFTLSQPGLRTLAVGMTAFTGEYSTDYSGLAAAAVISLLPVMLVFISMQRHFVDSIAGAVKQ